MQYYIFLYNTQIEYLYLKYLRYFGTTCIPVFLIAQNQLSQKEYIVKLYRNLSSSTAVNETPKDTRDVVWKIPN